MTATLRLSKLSPSLVTITSTGIGCSKSLKTGASVASTTFPTKPKTAAPGSAMPPALMPSVCPKTLLGKHGPCFLTIKGVLQTLPLTMPSQCGS